MKLFGVYFICCIGKFLNIVDEQLKLIYESGLYNKTDNLLIFITLINNDNEEVILNLISKYDINKKFIFIKSDKNEYEKFAINNYKKIISTITNSDYYLYYIHTKGVSKNENNIMDERRKILNYYTIVKHNINLKLLNDGYDAIGCSLSRYPKLHFSGNFWWSKSIYLNKLTDINDGYLSPEMYILSNTNCRYISLSNETNITTLDLVILQHKNDEDILKNLTTHIINNNGCKNLLKLC